MYQVVLGYIPLPITPSKITTSYGGRNETVELIDGSQVNIIKSPALTEISFEFMIPHQSYPFASLAGQAVGALSGMLPSALGNLGMSAMRSAILQELERMMKTKKPFYLIVVRMNDQMTDILAWNSYLKVTLENYEVIEDAENGFDIMVSVRLKKYVPYGTAIRNEDGSVTGAFIR